MRAFFQKYKWIIAYFFTLSFIYFYVQPRQEQFYLDEDIKDFEIDFLRPISIWTAAIIWVITFLIALILTKSIKKSSIYFIQCGLILSIVFFSFQNAFLTLSIFINRQHKLDTVTRKYQVYYMTDSLPIKEYFFPYDLISKRFSIDKKLINRLYNRETKQKDTIELSLNKGILGIPFSTKPFDEK